MLSLFLNGPTLTLNKIDSRIQSIMVDSIKFESVSAKLESRQHKREERQLYLSKVKRDYDQKLREDEQKKLRGEDQWMLPSLSERIADPSSKKEHKKKHKKEKKHKHKKKKLCSESNSEPDEPMWVEKGTGLQKTNILKVPQLQRDEWMASPLDIIPTITRDELRRRIQEDKQEKEKDSLIELGQHVRELNPYWKAGGSGLPEEEEQKKPSTYSMGGKEWLEKAYKRCLQQAEEEGRSVEAVAAERWGSLKHLKAKIAEAEKRENEMEKKCLGDGNNYSRERKEDYRSRDKHQRSQSSERMKQHRSRSFEQRNKSPDRKLSKDKKHSRKRSRSRDHRRSRSRSPNNSLSKQKHRSRSPELKSHDRKSTQNDSRSSKMHFMKPGDSETPSNSRFLKPGVLSGINIRSKGTSHVSSWRKSGIQKPDEATSSHIAPRQSSPASERKYDEKNSSSDSSSDSCDEKDENKETEIPIKILTEQEMNAIGAKIVKLEIMGQQDEADTLKRQLDHARELKAGGAKNPPASSSEPENVVVLTRSDRSGNVRPLSSGEHGKQPKGGRKKKMKVATHNRDGDREIYFADDDQHDLKSMVEREKLGTAEDANLMFARLAGNSIERTDDEFQIDDVFMQRANKKESSSKEHERQRSLAIGEHKKMAEAMEKCQQCLEKTSKHLIIAIGVKTYLCLPSHRPLTEGHCLIVPMQHVSAATALDEDVWTEVMVFRKGLTKLFQDRGEDIVFMETSMHVKWQPHMFIECIPLPKEIGDMSPIYFKKAIMETGSEWSQNKKCVDLSKKDIRHAVPKGFPYFSVDFGLQGGFAHVIEDEKTFPRYFGKEIIGGMLDVEPRLWRKPQKEGFEEQRKRVLQFADWWKPYDWTHQLKQDS